MSMMMMLAALVLPDLFAAPIPTAPIKIVAARASSTMPDFKAYTFGAGNLIDGRVDTSWQPAKSNTLGVGQWVELDLGATYEVSWLEVEQGLQKEDPELGDLYCRNNRASTGTFFFDDGSWGYFAGSPAQKSERVTALWRGDAGPGHAAKPVTRNVRFVVNEVLQPVDWKDLALAEIRVFGTPAIAATTAGLACDAPAATPIKAAVVEWCAVDAATRKKRDCAALVTAMATCHGWSARASRPLPAFDAAGVASGTLTQRYEIDDTTHQLELARAADGRWAVETHTRAVGKKPAPPAQETLFADDPGYQNPCWDKLGKQRP